jgi:hypothetical protein
MRTKMRAREIYAKAIVVAASLAMMAGSCNHTPPTTRPVQDSDLEQARARLLVSYSNFKSYGLTDPDEIYKTKLSPDRQALFEAIVRALFVELEDASGNPKGRRAIDFAEAVHGIWGVRPGDTEGRRMFRMSMRFRSGIREALTRSSNIPPASFGHVLLPVAQGGDDDPAFTGFDFKEGSAVVTFRQAGPRPTLQISLLSNDERVGEIDLDFDSGCGPPPIKRCHCRPANSDVGAHAASGDDNHLPMFNARVPFFTNALQSGWINTAAHCRESY